MLEMVWVDEVVPVDRDSGVTHLFHGCDENISLCGADVTDAELIEDEGPSPDDCVVCVDLELGECPRCGSWD